MSLPSHKSLFQPTLSALHRLGGAAAIADIEREVATELKLDPETAKLPHPGSNHTEIQYRLHWARTYLKHAGLVDNPVRGTWVLTEKGRQQTEIDADALDASVRAELRHRRESEPAAPDTDEETSSTGTFASVHDHPNNALSTPAADSVAPVRSLTPHLPGYESARHFLRILDGMQYAIYRDMVDTIWSQRGTPQETTDWANPETWIPERLIGDQQALALRFWRESKGKVNPRHLRGAWYLTTKHDLLKRDSDDLLRITERGRAFITQPNGPAEVKIDDYEGLFIVLRLVADKGPGWRGEFLPEFSDFCRTHTAARSVEVIKNYLYARLQNLVERGLIQRRGLSYEITSQGLSYLDAQAQIYPESAAPSRRQSDIRKLAQELRMEARQKLADYLSTMNPFKFEELIKLLLEEMGYDNVEATSPTNDKGVDVVANIELGISSVREVIQAKRHKGNINRTVLDALRGSLHRFGAVRGTVITTGRFSKGTQEAAFERGAAPITLIDGEKLLDLLMERQIGVAKKTVEYFDFDSAKLAQFSTDQVPTVEE